MGMIGYQCLAFYFVKGVMPTLIAIATDVREKLMSNAEWASIYFRGKAPSYEGIKIVEDEELENGMIDVKWMH